MPVRETVEIGLNRFARRGYDLDEVSLVPSRRTRDVDDVSTAWQIDAFRFEIPLVTSPSDAVVSPVVGGPGLPNDPDLDITSLTLGSDAKNLMAYIKVDKLAEISWI